MNLFVKYRAEKLTRRAAVECITWLAAGSGLAAAAGFQTPTIHHVSLQVSDLARSSEFYQRVFGCTARNREDGTVVLLFEQGHVILRRGTLSGMVDHFAIRIDHFDKDSAIRDLKATRADPLEDQVAGLHVKDPDGVHVQLTSNATYTGAGAAFTRTRLDHVSIYYGNKKRSIEFYQRVFGFPPLNQQASTVRMLVGKSHISLRTGNPPGTVDHFAIGIDRFNEEAVIRDLKARGATVVNGGNEGLHITDPDGYPVQVTANPD